MKLTKKEEAWFTRLQKCLDAAPESLKKKDGEQLRAYTIGDNEVFVYNAEKYDSYVKEKDYESWNLPDVCSTVDRSAAGMYELVFPFCVESTAG